MSLNDMTSRAYYNGEKKNNKKKIGRTRGQNSINSYYLLSKKFVYI